MNFLGVVEEITSDGKMVVTCETAPEIGDSVFDAKKKHIGSVKRIFGPVDKPYVSVMATDKSVLTDISGKKVYFEGATRYGKNKRRN